MRRWKRTLSFLFAVLFGLGGVFALLYLIAWLVIGRDSGHAPAILEGQTIVTRGRPMPDPEWTATLRRHFPVGTDEAELALELREQGFRIDRRGKLAVYEWQEPLCRMTLMVHWTAGPDRRVRDVTGGSAGMCL